MIYSPGIPLLEGISGHLPENSELILLAPNIAHTSGIAAWMEAYPSATVVATDLTIAKLKEAHPDVMAESLDYLVKKLPDHIALHIAPACKLGEVWISITLDDSVFWCVCDGFTNMQKYSSKPVKRFLQKVYGLKLGLWIIRSFRQNVTDKLVFNQWASEKFTDSNKNILIPCHGDIYSKQDFSEKARQLIQQRF